MKVFKFLPPYQREHKTTFPKAQKRSGVYIIKENGKITYVGMSGNNLYRTLYRHFEAWTHSQKVLTYQSRLKEYNYTVRIIFCTRNQAFRLEKYLIKKYRPRDNDEMYLDYEFKYEDGLVQDSFFSTKVTTEIPF